MLSAQEKRDILMARYYANKESVDSRFARDIERYRKGSFRIKVADGPGITAKVSQKTHDFNFGSNRVWNENNSRGVLLHRDMTPKKSALKLRELLSERWHTDLTLETDADGYISFRGFYGTYEAQAGDQVLTIGLHK